MRFGVFVGFERGFVLKFHHEDVGELALAALHQDGLEPNAAYAGFGVLGGHFADGGDSPVDGSFGRVGFELDVDDVNHGLGHFNGAEAQCQGRREQSEITEQFLHEIPFRFS